MRIRTLCATLFAVFLLAGQAAAQHDNPRFGAYFTTAEIRAELREVFGEIFLTRTTAE